MTDQEKLKAIDVLATMQVASDAVESCRAQPLLIIIDLTGVDQFAEEADRG